MKIVFVLLLSALSMLAQATDIGETLTPWTLNDQYDQPYTLNEQTRILLVARNMDGAKLVKAALQDQPKGYLEARNAVFLADVHGMPSLIGKWFAIPAMQKYTYRVVLDRDGSIAAQYPGAEDQVLWLQLQGNTVVSQHTFTSAEQLQKALQDTPAQ